MRQLFIHSALLVLLVAGAALAGQYQRTKDDRTLVWNEDHKGGDLASWSGKRDADGYATGYGTLTWYTPEDMLETGSNPPRKSYSVSSRVSGTMIHGKFQEASPRATAQATIEPEKPKKRGWFSFLRPRRKPSPPPIAETPKPRLRSSSTHVKETPETPSPAPTDAQASPTPTPSAASNSLDSLMHAPSSLKLDSPAASPAPAIPSPAATPDVSLQPEQPPSPSPTPQ